MLNRFTTCAEYIVLSADRFVLCLAMGLAMGLAVLLASGAGQMTTQAQGLADDIVGEPPRPDATPVTQWLAEHGDDVALVCLDSATFQDDLVHRGDELFQVASVYKVVILAELARQVDAGRISPDERVSLDTLNSYYLPNSDLGAHPAWLRTLPADTSEVTLRQLAYGMIRYSSNANSDYLLTRLGTRGFATLYDMLGLQDTPLPDGTFLSLFLAMDNFVDGEVQPDSADPAQLAERRSQLEALYLSSSAWRNDQIGYWQRRREARRGNPNASMRAYALQSGFFARFGYAASAYDVLRVLNSAYDETVFSSAARGLMQQALGWRFDDDPSLRTDFVALGTKGGSFTGILTQVYYIDPIVGDPLAVAIFYRNLPRDLWRDWYNSAVWRDAIFERATSRTRCRGLSGLLQAGGG